ncbi:MAG: ribonuclease HII [Jejuia sp.]
MRFLLCSLLLSFILGCSPSKKKDLQLIDYAPENSKIILKTSSLEYLTNGLRNNDFLKNFAKTKDIGIPPLEFLNQEGDVLICTSIGENDSLQHTFITHYTPSVFLTDSLKNYSEELLKYKSYSLKRSTLNDETFYHALVDSTFVLSTSEEIIRNTFNKKDRTTDLQKLYDVADDNKNISLLIDTEYSSLLPLFTNDSLTTKQLSNTFVLDIDVSQDDVFFNGIAKSNDSTSKIIDIFKNTVPQEHQTQRITPGNSDGFLSFTFDDFDTFQGNLNRFKKKDSISERASLFDNSIEIGIIYQGDLQAITLNSIDVIATQDALLSENQNIETYRDIDIFEFSKKELFKETLSPFATEISPTKYCIIDSFFVFSDSTELLENIIANYQNKTTLDSRNYYKDLNTKLSNECSLLMVYKPELLERIASKTNEDFDLDTYTLSAIQIIYDSNFAHIHGGVIKAKAATNANSVTEQFSVTLANDVLTNPQFVTNHVTKQKDIVVQDINNILYLISNKGNVLWKKRLNGSILGKVEQIDMYKNGRLQLAFATPNRVYVLDRKGRDVAPFPLRFNDEITQPLSVFDYDKNRKYRLMVTQGKDILLYDAQGKTVKGFNFKSAKSPIVSQPKHFRIGSKDYIIIKTKDKLHILNRKGSTRVTPKDQFVFSDQPTFVYQNKFTTTSQDGKLISIDSRGNTSTVNLGLSNNHKLTTTSKTRVTLDENKLGIKSKVLDLDFGNYTDPKIFYLNDKIYVSVTDLQSKKVFLFDSQGNPRQNFPVYGNSAIQLDNIDGDRSLEFVVKGDSNTIILYQIN